MTVLFRISNILDTVNPLRIIPRNDWTAQPPEENPIPLKLPVDRVIIAHTATTSCTTQVIFKKQQKTRTVWTNDY